MAATTQVTGGTLPRTAAGWQELAAVPAIVLTSEGHRLPERLDAEQLGGLLRFVEAGGRVLLLGYAVVEAHAMGLEPAPPDVMAPFRWGFDARARTGHAAVGLRMVAAGSDPFSAGLQEHGGQPSSYLLQAGIGLTVPECVWRAYEPQAGEVLARPLHAREGLLEPQAGAAMVRWSHGKGAVLGIGYRPVVAPAAAMPAGETAAATVEVQNSGTLLRNALQWLGDGAPPVRLAAFMLPAAGEPPPPPPSRPLAERELAIEPWLAQWGWQLDGDPAALPPQDRWLVDLLLPAWRSGAARVDVALGGEAGWPLPWRNDDPLRRPAGYRHDDARAHGAAELGALCEEGHARGMQVGVLLDPLPVSGAGFGEQLAGLRFLARELADRRRLGARAVDGFGLGAAFGDPDAYALRLWQDFQPAARAFHGGAGSTMRGVVPVLDADDGLATGLALLGVTRAFRGDFGSDEVQVACLSPQAAALPGAGPSAPDWLVEQLHDFVRPRRGRGAAAFWSGRALEQLAPETRAFVHGISADPLRAAIAMQLVATGKGGLRDLAQRLDPALPGLAPATALPATAHVLQNNHLRLCGSGGNLRWDPQGLAQFDDAHATLLAGEWVATRIAGARPSATQLGDEARDFLHEGARPPHGHDEELRLSFDDAQARAPAVLGCGSAPEWPRRVCVGMGRRTGRYELELGARVLRGHALLQVRLDGELLWQTLLCDGHAAERVLIQVPLGVENRDRSLFVECCGGAAALEQLRLVRRGDTAAESSVALAAGHRAELHEAVVATSLAEQSQWVMVGDTPVLLWRNEVHRADRGLRAERTFGLLRHGRLLGSAGGPAHRLQQPFVLAGDGPGVPPLAVVPLQLARHNHFELRDGKLVLHELLDANQVTVIGFVLLGDLLRAPLADLPGWLRNLQQPASLVPDEGRITIRHGAKFAAMQLVDLRRSPGTPFLVRENGWWTWRGAQALADGGELLRIAALPDDTVEIRCGAALLAGTRPTGGSMGAMALRDLRDDGAVVRVLPGSPLAAPALRLAAPFDEVLVDGQPHAWFDGDTVFLPARPGDHAVRVQQRGLVQPHVRSSNAPIERCSYDRTARELVLVVGVRPGLGDLPLVAQLGGPVPSGIDGGELVAGNELRHADAQSAQQAARGGTLIRFLPGVVRVKYGP